MASPSKPCQQWLPKEVIAKLVSTYPGISPWQQQQQHLGYALEAANVAAELACNVVDAVVQTSRPPSPNPFVGTFSALINPAHIFPRFKGARQSSAHAPPLPSRSPPLFLFADSTARRVPLCPSSPFCRCLQRALKDCALGRGLPTSL